MRWRCCHSSTTTHPQPLRILNLVTRSVTRIAISWIARILVWRQLKFGLLAAHCEMEPQPEPGPQPEPQPEPPGRTLSASQKKRAKKARQKARQRSAATSAPARIQRYDDLAAQVKAPVTVHLVPGCPDKGKGAFATRSVAVDEKLWCEAPMLSVQHEGNRSAAVVCAECCRWVGSPEAVLNGVIQWADATRKHGTGDQSAAAPLPPLSPAPGVVCCDDECGTVYCSEECRRVAWAIHHRMLCTGCGAGGTAETLSKGAALHRGAVLCYEQLGKRHGCQEVLTLLARSVVDVLGGWESGGRTAAALAEAMGPYDSLYCIPWWDVPRSGEQSK